VKWETGSIAGSARSNRLHRHCTVAWMEIKFKREASCGPRAERNTWPVINSHGQFFLAVIAIGLAILLAAFLLALLAL
jgi:hypothetical protein